MKWEEVCRLYPHQFVNLKILGFHVKSYKNSNTDVALIDRHY